MISTLWAKGEARRLPGSLLIGRELAFGQTAELYSVNGGHFSQTTVKCAIFDQLFEGPKHVPRLLFRPPKREERFNLSRLHGL